MGTVFRHFQREGGHGDAFGQVARLPAPDARDVVAAIRQQREDVPADEARRAGDEDASYAVTADP